MGVLIRFEDTYGIRDVAALCKLGIDNEKIDGKSTKLVEVNEGLFLQYGLSSVGVYDMGRGVEVLENIASGKIEHIVVVFDLDDLSGDKTKILQVESFKKHACKMMEQLEEAGVKCEIHFMPVMYCAETVYMYILLNCMINPCEVVNEANTTKLHGDIMAGVLGKRKARDIKRIEQQLRNIDITDRLTTELNKCRRDNKHLLEWLTDTEDVLRHTLSYDEAIRYIEGANEFFNESMNKYNIVVCAGIEIDVNDKEGIHRFKDTRLMMVE